MSRRAAALLLLPLALATAASVQPPAATTGRYKVETIATSVVDLSAVGQGEQRNEFTITGFVTITLTDSADGRVMHAVLDSSSVAPPAPGTPPGALEGQKGAMYHAFINRSGKTENFAVMGDSAAPQGGAVMVQLLRDFFPNVKPGFKPGDSWTDSTETRDAPDTGTITTISRVTSYSVGAEAPWAGSRGHQVATTSSFTMSAQSDTPGGPTSVEGSGTGQATWYVTVAGAFLGGTSATSADLTAMTAFGDFPVKQSSKTTISALP
ncbi:MAG TPA: hypothetical protein VJ773_06585 [Gemmatimonadales bacterium]|nr:hypothetical protein [Gemmatimonadales bacterium]